MAVTIKQPRRNMESFAFNHECVRGELDFKRAYVPDFAAGNEQVRVRKHALRTGGPQRRIAYEQGGWVRNRAVTFVGRVRNTSLLKVALLFLFIFRGRFFSVVFFGRLRFLRLFFGRSEEHTSELQSR